MALDLRPERYGSKTLAKGAEVTGAEILSNVKPVTSISTVQTPGAKPGGKVAVNDWISRYNRVMDGLTKYEDRRNGGYTKDASGGYMGNINSLIADFENIRDVADQFGFQDSQKYLDNLKQIQDSIGQMNDVFAQFDDEEEYSRYMEYLQDQETKRSLDLDAYSREITALEQQLADYDPQIDWTDTNQRKQYDKGLQELGDEINRRKQYLAQAQRLQKQEADAKRFADIRNRDDFSENSGFDTDNQEIGYRYVNADAAGRLDLEQRHGDPVRQFGSHGWDSLNEEEKQVYNYLMNTGDRQGAADYLRYLEENLQYRKGQATDAAMDALVEDDSRAKALRYAFMANVGYDQHLSGMRGAGNLLMGKDDYVPPSSTQVAGSLVREDLAQDGKQLPQWLGGGSTGQMVGDLISTTANMAPSMAVGLISPNTGAAMMGTSAAGSAYQEALNEGYSVDQARGYGILSGASEIVMEKVLGGISAYGGNALGKFFTQNMKNADTALKRIAKELGGSMLSEFSEEYLQEVLTPVFQNLTLGTDNEMELVSAEALYAGFLGAITGGVLEGPSAIANSRNATVKEPLTTELANEAVGDEMSATVGVSKMETVQVKPDMDSFAQQFGTQADAVKRNYMEGQDLQEYEVGFQTAYAMGLEGGKQEALGSVPYLSQSQREIAFSLGRDAAAAQKAAAPKKAAVTAKMTTEEGTQDVTIAEVVDMDDTTMTFRLEDGRTVTDNELDFEKGQELMAAAWELGMDVKTVNTIVTESAANAAADADQAVGIQQAYHYGQQGYTMDQLTKHGTDAAALTDGQRKAAWEAGRQIHLQKAEAAPGGGVKVSGKTSGVWFDAGGGNVRAFDEADTSGLSDTALAGARTAKVLQKLGIGRNYYFYESYVNSKGDRVYKDENGHERKAPNGWYDPDGSIHIDLNAGAEGKGLTMYTLSHELTHFVEKWSPKKYHAMADFLVANYAKAGNVDAMVAEKQAELSGSRGTEVSYEEAYSEFIADSMEAMLSDGNVLEKLQELKKTDKSLFDKIREFFDNLGRKIREIYKDLTPDSLEGQAVLQMKDQIDQIQQLFAEALVEAGENFQAAEGQKNTAHEGRKFSDRYPPSQLTEQDRKYLDAVNRGDMETAQKMVDDAAKAAGYDSPKLYHGTNAFGFTEFITSMSDDRISIFTTSNSQVAETYSGETSRRRISDKAKITPEELENAAPEELLKLLRENISKDYRLVSEAERDQIIEANRAPLLQAARSVENLYVINMDMFDDKKKDALFAVSGALRDMSKADEYSVFMDKKMSYDDALWDLRWLDDSLTDEVISAIGRNENLAFRELTKWLGATIFHADAEYSRINGTPWMNSTEAVNELFPRLFKGVYELYGRTGNAFEMEADGANWNQLDGGKIGQYGPVKTRDVARYAKENGHDSAIFRNIKDNGDYTYGGTSDVYVFFGSDNLKSADPVTYDDAGNVIPLSERFNPEKKDIRYSDRKQAEPKALLEDKYYARQIDKWDGKDHGGSFRVGQVSDPLLKIGIPDVDIWFDQSKAAKQLDGKKEIDKDVLKKIPYLLEHPIAISESYDNTVMVFGEMYDENGNPIVVALRVNSTNRRNHITLVNKIRSIGTRTHNLDKLLSDEAILYLNETKKETNRWFNALGRSTPFGGTKFGLIRSISFDVEKSNILQNNYPDISQVQRQDRSTGTSNRALLAGAFEDLARSPAEMEFLQKYQENIGLLNEQEAKLQEIRTEIRELTFGKGPKDPKRLEQLQEEAGKTANRIHIYDKKLLQLEAAKPLRDVLDREREKVRKATRQKGQEAMAEYREKRKESAAKKDAKRKIRKTVIELDKLLNRGDKKKNVKSGMTSMVDSVLKLADALFMDEYTNRDMLRNGVGVELTDAEEKLFREAQQILQQAESGAAIEGMEFTSEVDAMNQLKKLDQKLTGKMAGLKDVFARERKRLYGTTVSDLLGKLADEYSRLSEAEDGAVRAAKDENVYAHLLQLQKDVGGTTVRDMTLGQMEAVADAFTMVLTTVRNANKMFAKNLKFKRDTLAAMVMGEIGAAVKKVSKLVRPVKNAVDTFSWNNLKPVYAFERLGSETLKTLYQNIRNGQDVWSRDMQEADTFRREQYRKHGWKKWDPDKLHSFEFESGKVELNLGQIMSLYAYSRREQALDHLLKGGFVFSGSTEVMVKEHGIQRRYLKKDATAYNLTADELLQVVDTLTNEQKAFVEEMQTYLSDVMGGKGNEISLQMYGIKSYGEKNYFPIRSAGQYMERAKEDSFRKEQGQISIVNSGFTKSTTPKANNPITLDGFMNVWAEHVNDMSMYHGFALPMEDFRRVYNYSSPNMEVGNSQSVNAVIENAFGKAATGYIDQLYKDLNGGALTDNREGISKKLVGLHKKAAVFASASVVVQQPSAIVRAFALIDPRHFIGPKVDRKRHKQLWEEVKKYAPVAFVKEMGYFDTGMGRSARDFLQAEEYSGIREKMTALFKDADYRDEILGKAPALADELTWCSIWEAVKRETKAKNPGMDVRSDAFLQIAGARFSEVIDKTQVYDSVLSRSANMRSKSGLMNMVTSFMAEPTTSINMLEDALRSGDRQQLKRTVGAVYGSVLLNSLLVSLVYAARDDDEDETWCEKYLSSVAVEMMDGINPITYYPILRDIWSIGQGFDVERADMTLISDFADAAKKVIAAGMNLRDAAEEKKVTALAEFKDSLWGMTDTVASLTGLPVKNIRRDIEGARNMVRTIQADLNTRDTTGRSLMDAVLGEVMNSIPIGGLLYSKSKRDRLYGALVAGDAAYVQRLKAGYKSDSAYHSAIKLALRDNDSRIWEAAVAWNSGDMETYLRIAKEIRGENRFDQDDIVLAIRAEASSMLESESESASTVKGYFTSEKFGVALAQNNTGMADIIRKDLIDTKVANGKTREEAAKSVESAARSQLKELFEAGSITGTDAEKLLVRYGGYDQEEASDKVADWKFEAEYGFTYSDRSDAYKNGEISQEELRSILMDVGGKTREEADLQIQVYDWEASGYDGVTFASVRDYNEYCARYSVPKDIYLHIKKVSNNTKNDVDSNGKTIYYSAMKKIMAEIGAQYTLTSAQKYAVARSLGWSEKNIEKYKTWY